MTKKNKKYQNLTVVPNSGKLCTCGQQIFFAYYYDKEGERRIVPIAKDKEPASLFKEEKEIYTSHFLNCPDANNY